MHGSHELQYEVKGSLRKRMLVCRPGSSDLRASPCITSLLHVSRDAFRSDRHLKTPEHARNNHASKAVSKARLVDLCRRRPFLSVPIFLARPTDAASTVSATLLLFLRGPCSCVACILSRQKPWFLFESGPSLLLFTCYYVFTDQ